MFWIRQFLSDGNAHRRALEEVLFVSGISLIPLIALPFIDDLRRNPSSVFDVGSLLYEAIAAGQLYLYSFAIFGTLFWLCQKDYEAFDRFPPRRYLTLLVVLPSLLIFIVYSYDPAMSHPLSHGLVVISIAVYALYNILYYVLLVFDNLSPPEAEETLRESANELIGEYEQQLRDGP